jgi:hypothetical protein
MPVSPDPHRPAARLQALAWAEFEQLGDQLALARRGRDRALHKARKSLQRLRAIVRLLAPNDPVLAQQENRRLSRWRRRLAPLRDAAARRQTFRVLATRPRWSAHAEALRALAEVESELHAQTWASHPADSVFWLGVERERAALGERLAHWPFARVTRESLETALDRAEKRLRRSWSEARGECGRERRHELRRKLRRYANLRRACAVARNEGSERVQALLDAAQRCGHEGDLWMAVVSARRAARTRPALRPLLRALDAERRAMCRRHDRLLGRLDID